MCLACLHSNLHHTHHYGSRVTTLLSIFVTKQRNTKGIDLLDKVCDHINLVERDYFSLTYLDKENIRVSSHKFSFSLSLDKYLDHHNADSRALFVLELFMRDNSW